MLKSMKIGDIAEQELIDYLNQIGMQAEKNTDKNLRLDFDVVARYNGQILTFEVKNDAMASKTGNMCIEYHNTKKDTASGLHATKADWWVHKLENTLWIIRVSELKVFTLNEKPDKHIKSGGDKNANLFIYKMERFTSIAKDLSTILKPEDLL